jgi:ATP-binding cassette subfamily B protein
MGDLNIRLVIRSLFPFLLQFKWSVLLALLCLLAAKGAVLLMPRALKEIIDSVDPAVSKEIVFPLIFLLIYGLLRFGSVFFGELRDALFSRVTERAMRIAGLDVFNHLHRLELEFHLGRQTGGIARDIERGTRGINFLLRFMMFNIVPTLFEITMVGIIFALTFSPWYAVITITAVTAFIFFTVLTTEWRNKFVREANKADSESNTRAIDSLLNYETVKYFNNEKYEADVYDIDLTRWEKARLKNRMSLFLLNSGQALIIASAITIMMIMATRGILEKALTLGDLAMVNAYMIQLFMPLNFLGFVYREIRRSLTDIENMFMLLERKPRITDRPGAKEFQFKGGHIQFEGVDFAYHAERPIIKNLSFEIKPGEKVAIVGPSGSGKSTIARLLFRFYDIENGSIKVDGQDIREITQDSLRRQIGVVPQDTVLFNDTIRSNVAYGRPGCSDDEVGEVIEMAHLEQFISSLPGGDMTLVGERGMKVSGGEKQRIAIARVLLKGSPIIIFDEATSSLDSESEQAILRSMNEIARGHTSLVIAHRLSTITDADRIIVLSRGEKVEEGDHISLLDNGGLYSSLWDIQQKETINKQSSL